MSPRIPDSRFWAVALILATLLAALLFTVDPALDLTVSRLFFVRGAGFPSASDPPAIAARWLIWRLSEGMFLLSLVALTLASFDLRLTRIPVRRWVFVALLYLAGPIALVNGILKSHSGRARPADIAEFGGSAQFTPPLEIAHQCAANCSFVSGEGAAATAFAIAVTILVLSPGIALSRALRRILIALAVAVGIAGSVLRVTAGRHFLSDALFAALFTGLIALVLHWILLREKPDRHPGGGR